MKCKDGDIILNDEHSEYKFFRQYPNSIHPYLLHVIDDLKIIQNEKHAFKYSTKL